LQFPPPFHPLTARPVHICSSSSKLKVRINRMNRYILYLISSCKIWFFFHRNFWLWWKMLLNSYICRSSSSGCHDHWSIVFIITHQKRSICDTHMDWLSWSENTQVYLKVTSLSQ
jgi:hypothetical protein